MYSLRIVTITGEEYLLEANADLVYLGLCQRPLYNGDEVREFYLSVDAEPAAAWERGVRRVFNGTDTGVA